MMTKIVRCVTGFLMLDTGLKRVARFVIIQHKLRAVRKAQAESAVSGNQLSVTGKRLKQN